MLNKINFFLKRALSRVNKHSDLYASFPPELWKMPKETELSKRNYSAIDTLHYDIIREYDFVKVICPHWLDVGLDTTYFSLRLSDLIEEPVENKSKIVDFVKSMWISYEDCGAYKQTFNSKFASVHGIHSAIGIINFLYSEDRNEVGQLKCQRPIGRKILRDTLGDKEVFNIINYLTQCQNPLGGFSQYPSHVSINDPIGINTTASVLWCLWHLEALDDKLRVSDLVEFVGSLTVRHEGLCGFKNEITDNSRWTCSTYYGLRILMMLHTNMSKFSTKNQQIINDTISHFKDKNGKQVFDFLLASFNVESGGFGATPDSSPNLIHTKDVLSVLIDIQGKYTNLIGDFDYKSILSENFSRIIEFLRSCYFNGGYGFAQKKYYQPNIYATYLGYRVRNMLFQACGDSPACTLANESLLSTLELSSLEKQKIKEFIRLCSSNTVGGYKGYSRHNKYLPPEHLEYLSKESEASIFH